MLRPFDSDIKWYKGKRKLLIGQGKDVGKHNRMFAELRLPQKHYKMIAGVLKLKVDPEAIHQIEFIES